MLSYNVYTYPLDRSCVLLKATKERIHGQYNFIFDNFIVFLYYNNIRIDNTVKSVCLDPYTPYEGLNVVNQRGGSW